MVTERMLDAEGQAETVDFLFLVLPIRHGQLAGELHGPVEGERENLILRPGLRLGV